MARDVTDDTYYITTGGKIPVRWTAPEVKLNSALFNHRYSYIYVSFYIFQALLYQKYSVLSDIWSYGCVMFEIWSLGCKPFENNSGTEVRK